MWWRSRESSGSGPAEDAASVPSCSTCRHFVNDPRIVEPLTPGLVSFGSGDASVRADDGLCLLHERYVDAQAGCSHYETGTL
jgi:hypothetical protein